VGPEELTRTEWDAIIVGTGMGGATLGHALAKAGQRVLFCERGRNTLPSAPDAVRGEYPEERGGAPELLARGGRTSEEVIDESGKRPQRFLPFTGSGTGGSTGLFGMALERFSPADFSPRQNHPDVADPNLPEAWPVSFAQLTPFYEAAEAMYRVRGTADPLRADVPRFTGEPPTLTPEGAALFAHFTKQGLHPYRLPLACEFVPGCHGCQSILCDLGCKNDSARICLTPAIERHGAVLLDGCHVARLEADRTRVSGVCCTWRGRSLLLRGRRVILAAGALQTPSLLLRSRSDQWPIGLANGSDLVGRNLMRHLVDLYLIEPLSKSAVENRFKELAFNDFYRVDGLRMGSVQSFGRLPPSEMVLQSLQKKMSLVRAVSPLLRPFLKRLVDRSITFATIAEDLPSLENRVLPESPEGQVRFVYRVSDADRARITQLRQLMKRVLKSRRWRVLKEVDNNERIAHVCGTCRFGDDPQTSVLDASNRAHELDNLYVVDTSFFPSSGGTNPSLTVAANALRVAAELTHRKFD